MSRFSPTSNRMPLPNRNLMNVSISELETQLAHTEQELELAKSHVHRCDGAIQLLKHLIEGAKKASQDKEA